MGTDMKWNPSKIYYLLAGAVTVLMAAYTVPRATCLIMLPDEFGYWANAAAMLGMDWSGISSLHSYYSFGYSFLLLPLLKYCDSPLVMYRFSILLNFLMLFGHACILYRLMQLLFPKSNEKIATCVSAAGACYSGVTAYVSLSMTETLLACSFLCTVLLLLRFLEKPKAAEGMLLAFLLVYLFIIHMRSMAVLAAAALTLVCAFGGVPARKRDRRKMAENHWIKYLAGLLLGLLAAACLAIGLKIYLDNNLYHLTSEEMLGWNGFTGQWKKTAGLFCAEGIRNFLFGVVGKLFYLGNATFFTFYWGMLFLGKKVHGIIKGLKKEDLDKKNYIYLFLFLAVLGTFALTAVYLSSGNRIDGIVYGRYNEFVLPVVICLGLVEMLRNRAVVKGTALMVLFHSLCIWVIDAAIQVQDLTAFQGYMSMGISFAINDRKALIANITRGPFIWCSILAVFLAAGVIAVRKYSKRVWGLLLLAGIFLWIGWKGNNTYFYPHSRDNLQDIELAGLLETELENRPESEIYYIHQGSTEYVDNLQFALKDRSIRVLPDKEKAFWETERMQIQPGSVDDGDFIIVYKEYEHRDWLARRYDTVLQNRRFEIFYQDKFTNVTDVSD